MKRSEIIRLIQKEIYSITQDDILYDSFSFSRNLLDKLESAGMLPPERPEESYRVNKQGRLVDVSNSWEPEDKNSKQNKLKPTPLTDEELADVIANDEDLQNEA